MGRFPWEALKLDRFRVVSHAKTVLFHHGVAETDGSAVSEASVPRVVFPESQQSPLGVDGAIDLRLMARVLYPTLAHHDLETLVAHHGIAASDDPRTLGTLFERMLEDALTLDRQILSILAQVCPEETGTLFGHILLEARPQPVPAGEPPDADAARDGAPAAAASVADAPAWTVDEILGRGGLIERALDGYEFRSGQLEMSARVAKTLWDGGALVSEAGPGTGKTFAYLVPALLYLRHVPAARVVVSTRTKQLQEQLFSKDLPFLVSLVAPSLNVALLKGRENYLCKRRWNVLLSEMAGSLEADRAALLAPLVRWLSETQTGDIEENGAFLAAPGARRLWSRLCDSSLHCTAGFCLFEEDCFSIQARRRCRKADLVVVNHSLLLGDLVANGQVLGRYSHLVIDEAHALEAATRTAFTASLSPRIVARLADDLAPRRGRRQGWLQRLPFSRDDADVLVAIDQVGALRTRSDELFLALDRVIPAERRGRLDGLAEAAAPTTDFVFALRQLEVSIEGLRDRLEEPEILREGEGHLATIRDMGRVAETLNLRAEENSVHWYERAADALGAHVTPLDVAPLLAEKLFAPLEGAILTSATLSTGDSFDFFSHAVGLDRAYEPVHALTVESPFAYEERMKILLPGFLPSLVESVEAHTEELAKLLSDLVQRLDRKTLVLFTSYRLLEAVRERLDTRTPVLAQGVDGPRTKIIDRFQRHRGGILLLGTDSFWEGLDLPGDALELLVITRLPFSVPSDPIQAALGDCYVREGRDAFRDLALPQAVLKLRQGVGRLIRTTQDRGAVLLTDHRIISKRYGGRFRRALPVPVETIAEEQELLRRLSSWYANGVS